MIVLANDNRNIALSSSQIELRIIEAALSWCKNSCSDAVRHSLKEQGYEVFPSEAEAIIGQFLFSLRSILAMYPRPDAAKEEKAVVQ